MQYSRLPAEVEAAGIAAWSHCAVDWPHNCLKAWTACCMKVSMLSTGVACTTSESPLVHSEERLFWTQGSGNGVFCAEGASQAPPLNSVSA